MKTFPRLVMALGVALSLVSTAAFAGPTYKFHLLNKTTQYTITGFQTYQDAKWSSWSNVKIDPGEETDMDRGSS
jgi:hypothetical protein